MTTRPILNVSEVELKPTMKHGGDYEAKMGAIAPRLGAKKLGYNVTVVAPGKRAFPKHNHHANEEMFFVIAGAGEVRIGGEAFPICEGDVIACPPGGAETAHQIVNTGTAELRYLAVSTKLSPEIAEYPESKKFGVLSEVAGADGKPGVFRSLHRASESLDYWDGE